MPISGYLQSLRAKVGPALLVMPSVAVIVYNEAGEVLLAQHSEGGRWVPPGGSLEPNETPADAAVREMWEETGLLVEPVRVIGVYGGPEFEVIYRNGDRVTYVITVFEGRVLGGTPRADGTEVLQLAYVSAKAAAQLATPAYMQVILPDVFRARQGTYFQAPRWQPMSGSG